MCIFPYCWYATVLSMNLHTIGDDAYKSLWYVYSVKVQICTQRIIAYAQIRRNFHGYNIFICSLEVFMKVSFCIMILLKVPLNIKLFTKLQIVKASASYYLMLKSFWFTKRSTNSTIIKNNSQKQTGFNLDFFFFFWKMVLTQ